ncbi:MAG TPA: hypothetical protein DDY91_09390 [Planctomycetaceae bacterium]|nr:hypothetical protein [Planctomycetaceae bacterium]
MKATYILGSLALLATLAGLYWVFNPTDPETIPTAEMGSSTTSGRRGVDSPPKQTAEPLVGQPSDTPDDLQPNSKPATSTLGDTATSAAAKSEDESLHGPPPEPPKPMLAGWESPQALLVFTGEQHGYVEPCGCSLKQLGGVSRRADFFRQIQEKGWPTLACDVGGLVNHPTRKQGKLKLQMSLHALKDMAYAAVAPGPEELRNGIELITYEERPPFVACNLVLGGDRDLGVIVPQVISDVGGLKVAVTAVLGLSLAPELTSQIDAGEVEVLDPVESLQEQVAVIEESEPDLRILLLHAPPDEARKIASKFVDFDLIVATHGPEEPNPQPSRQGKTLWVWPGQKGKYVGVVGVFRDEDKLSLRYEPVALDEDRFRDTAHMRDHMRHYQELLELQNLVANEPAIEHPRNAAEKEPNDFVGAKTCGECHKKAYEHWKTTGHARGTISIKQGRAGQEGDYISRIHDAECVACHVTGWDSKEFVRYRSGWVDENSTAHLAGQQCENCHGPGSRHSEVERLLAKGDSSVSQSDADHWRDFAHLSIDTSFDLCVRCHDGDNDPHFHKSTFPKYWDKIKHPWLD